MSYIESIILGIIQGLTEFLPVSSSGHLVIGEHLLNLSLDSLSFEIFVHFGTLLSVLFIYYTDIIEIIKSIFKGVGKPIQTYQNDSYFRLGIFVIVGTIPAALAGLLFKDFFEKVFHNINLVGISLIFTGVILGLTYFVNRHNQKLSIFKSIIIGAAQMLAIIPGISRSGMTISTGLYLKIQRKKAAKFSFLLATPAIFGSMLITIIDIIGQSQTLLPLGILLTGLISSFIVGIIAIKFLLKLLEQGRFKWFAPYCIGLGLIVILFL